MVKLNKIYTKTGDSGITGLSNGSRVAKHDPRIEACGVVDEANACIGLARLYTKDEADVMLSRIQNDLFDFGADICTPSNPKNALRIVEKQVNRLEYEIDAMNAELKSLNSFVLPGGGAASAHLHLARTIVRRAERQMTKLALDESINKVAIRYINRLSDHLFTMARLLNEKGHRDVLWQPGKTQKK